MVSIGTSPLVIAVFFGAAQNCLSKGMKYSVFDVTKEIAFIPLSHECKLKGKAAIDGVGSRLGKSGGSLIHGVLLMFFGTLTRSAPFVGVILMTVIGFWIMATRSLGRQFNALTQGEGESIAIIPESSPKPILSTQVPAEAK
jgi:AAA family ATP:ADP antiporter